MSKTQDKSLDKELKEASGRIIAKLGFVLSMLGSIAWFVRTLDFEPALVFLGACAAYLTIEFRDAIRERPIRFRSSDFPRHRQFTILAITSVVVVPLVIFTAKYAHSITNPTYSSSSTVIYQPQYIHAKFFKDEDIVSIVYYRVVTRYKLEQILLKLNYKGFKEMNPIEQSRTINTVRSNITFTKIYKNELSNETFYSISYRDADPSITLSTANEIVTEFLAEHIRYKGKHLVDLQDEYAAAIGRTENMIAKKTETFSKENSTSKLGDSINQLLLKSNAENHKREMNLLYEQISDFRKNYLDIETELEMDIYRRSLTLIEAPELPIQPDTPQFEWYFDMKNALSGMLIAWLFIHMRYQIAVLDWHQRKPRIKVPPSS